MWTTDSCSNKCKIYLHPTLNNIDLRYLNKKYWTVLIIINNNIYFRTFKICRCFMFLTWINIVSERNLALTGDDSNGPWPNKRRRGSLYKNMGLLCCMSRQGYLWWLRKEHFDFELFIECYYELSLKDAINC